MNSAKAFIVIFIACSFVAVAPAQRRKTRRVSSDIRILKNYPTVYISFERLGKREPRRTDEGDEGVWLRLHNNTRWRLSLKAYGAPDKAFARGNEEEVGMFYEVEAAPKPQLVFSDSPTLPPLELPSSGTQQPKVNTVETLEIEKYKDCEVAFGDRCHACSVIELPPGKSLLFSVPREHLCENLMLYVSYNYQWEFDEGRFAGSGEPQHNVYFYGSQIPKGCR